MDNVGQIALLENEIEMLDAELEYIYDRKHTINVRIYMLQKIITALENITLENT
jgi:prefoldin subunit 5